MTEEEALRMQEIGKRYIEINDSFKKLQQEREAITKEIKSTLSQYKDEYVDIVDGERTVRFLLSDQVKISVPRAQIDQLAALLDPEVYSQIVQVTNFKRLDVLSDE